jgi:hypothetical protein
MYADEIDDLLKASALQPGPRPDALATDLATAVVHADRRAESESLGAKRKSTRKWLIGSGAAIGVVVFTAAMTGSAWMMSVPPFMTLEPGLQRVYEPISYIATWENGEQRRCQLFLEFKGLDDDELEDVAAHIRTKNWASWREDLSDAATGADGPELRERFRIELQSVVPDLRAVSVSEAAGPIITGYGTSCEDGQ